MNISDDVYISSFILSFKRGHVFVFFEIERRLSNHSVYISRKMRWTRPTVLFVLYIRTRDDNNIIILIARGVDRYRKIVRVVCNVYYERINL